ncbi:MAG: hypothetical protein FIA97_06225 [Methylococcaceae bacterium]|nr:hypothetical protein [Methylococcaceae bacterium]
MKQEINFYRRPEQSDWREISPLTVGLAVAATAIALTAVSAFKYQTNRDLLQQQAASIRQADAMAAQLAQLQAQFPDAKPDPELIAEADRRQRQVEHLRSLLELARGEQETQQHGFSPYLEGLARHPMADLWLREVRLRRGGRDIELAGSALASDSIPKLVQALGAENAFKSTLFSDFIVRRPEQQAGQVNFTLRTWVPQQEQGHGQP